MSFLLVCLWFHCNTSGGVLTERICVSGFKKKVTDKREHPPGDRHLCIQGKTDVNMKNEEKSTPPVYGILVGI